jgi:hypothetical protein
MFILEMELLFKSSEQITNLFITYAAILLTGAGKTRTVSDLTE